MPRIPREERTKSERFHIRATVRQASLIRAGATCRNGNLTEYIVDSTCTQAEVDIADQNHFMLPPKAWNAFVKALDAPPRVPPGLKRLFERDTAGESKPSLHPKSPS
jgi:uncharacterized protein (DUF1778 family)